MSSPNEHLAITDSVEACDAYDALMLSVQYAQSTIGLVELVLADAAPDGELSVSPALMAETLQGVESHLGAIRLFSESLARRLTALETAQ